MMIGTRLKATLLAVFIIACVVGLYPWLTGEKRQDDFAPFDKVADSAKGHTGGAVESPSPQRTSLVLQHDEDAWLALLESATEPGESWEEGIETAFVGADTRRLLSLYRSWIGQPSKLHARMEILNSLRGLDDRALAESLILEALGHEEGQDGFKLGAFAGLALGRTLWGGDTVASVEVEGTVLKAVRFSEEREDRESHEQSKRHE